MSGIDKVERYGDRISVCPRSGEKSVGQRASEAAIARDADERASHRGVRLRREMQVAVYNAGQSVGGSIHAALSGGVVLDSTTSLGKEEPVLSVE